MLYNARAQTNRIDVINACNRINHTNYPQTEHISTRTHAKTFPFMHGYVLYHHIYYVHICYVESAILHRAIRYTLQPTNTAAVQQE